MRRAFSRFRFAAWATAVVARSVLGNPRAAWRILATRHDRRDPGPDAGWSGAGAPAPLHPPPPILAAAVALQLPPADADAA